MNRLNHRELKKVSGAINLRFRELKQVGVLHKFTPLTFRADIKVLTAVEEGDTEALRELKIF